MDDTSVKRVSFLLSLVVSSEQLDQLSSKLTPVQSDKLSALITEIQKIDDNNENYTAILAKTIRSFARSFAVLKLGSLIFYKMRRSQLLKQKDCYLLALSFSVKPLISKVANQVHPTKLSQELSNVVVSSMLALSGLPKDYVTLWLIFKLLGASNIKLPKYVNYKTIFPIVFSHLFSTYWLNNDHSSSYVTKLLNYIYGDLLPISKNSLVEVDYTLNDVIQLINSTKNHKFHSSLIAPSIQKPMFIPNGKFEEVSMLEFGSAVHTTVYQSILNPLNTSISSNLLRLPPRFVQLSLGALPIFLVINKSLLHSKDDDEKDTKNYKVWVKESIRSSLKLSTFIFVSTVPSAFILRQLIDLKSSTYVNFKIVGLLSGILTILIHDYLPKRIRLSKEFLSGLTVYLIRTALLSKYRFLKSKNSRLVSFEKIICFAVLMSAFKLKNDSDFGELKFMKVIGKINSGFGVL